MKLVLIGITFSKSMIFYLVGLIMGVYFYENTLSHVFNIRKLNPYDMIGKYVPPVLPAGTSLTLVTSNPIPGGTTGLGTDYLAQPAATSIAAPPVPPAAPTLAGINGISYM